MSGEPTRVQPVSRRVAVVTVSYNTAELTALLLWSLHRVLGRAPEAVVVVDNGSTDGSADLLGAAEANGLCTLIRNKANRGHGPALNQAIELVADSTSAEWAWVLDSDCVVARPDVLDAVDEAVAEAHPALIGEAHWDKWLARERFELYSMILDLPQLLALSPPSFFTEGGDPAIDLITRVEAADLQQIEFPFGRERFIIHRGRGSLASVVARGDRKHPMYEWAKDHHEPHYGSVAGAEVEYHVLRERFLDDASGHSQPDPG